MMKCRTAVAAMALAALHTAGVAGPAYGAKPSVLADQMSQLIEDTVKYPTYAWPSQVREGDVLVTFVVGATGNAEKIEIAQTSHHLELDLAVCRGISALHHFPEGATGKRFVSVVLFRDGSPNDGADMNAEMRSAMTQVLKRWPDALVPSAYRP